MIIEEKKDNILIDEMLKAGAHFGYSRSRRFPGMDRFVAATKNKKDLIDVEKTEMLLESAKNFVSNLAKENKKIIFVGTKPEAKKIIEEIALALDMPYVINRWVGGVLTNFSEIRKRINKLLDLKNKKEKGELDFYTKKEKLLLDRQVEDLEHKFSGVLYMEKIPDVVFIIDNKKEKIAVAEARQLKLPIISLSNTDCDVDDIDYPIVANNGAKSSIDFFVKQIAEAYRRGELKK